MLRLIVVVQCVVTLWDNLVEYLCIVYSDVLLLITLDIMCLSCINVCSV